MGDSVVEAYLLSRYVDPEDDPRSEPKSDQKVHPPFDPSQIDSLNGFQESNLFHPFTCPEHSDGPEGVLVAVERGMICPTCGYEQHWVYRWMADWSWEELRHPAPASEMVVAAVDLRLGDEVRWFGDEWRTVAHLNHWGDKVTFHLRGVHKGGAGFEHRPWDAIKIRRVA